MQRRIPALVLSATLAAIAIPASAFITDFLDKSPMAYFTDKDRELLNAASIKALNGVDGSTTDWENPDSTHRGSVTPLKTYERNGKPCRAVKYHNEAEGYTSDGIFEMCKVEESGSMEGWMFTGEKPPTR
jgi:hypothetical protein